MHLDTRFAQLDVATKLELWQEAYRSVEDISGLMQMSKKPLKQTVLAEYYEKLTQIFLVAENYLLHAFAYKKYYAVSKHQNKSMPAEERKRMTSTVLLSALAIPVVSTTRGQYGYLDIEEQQNRNMKLATLIGLNKQPTREALLKELVKKKFFFKKKKTLLILTNKH